MLDQPQGYLGDLALNLAEILKPPLPFLSSAHLAHQSTTQRDRKHLDNSLAGDPRQFAGESLRIGVLDVQMHCTARDQSAYVICRIEEQIYEIWGACSIGLRIPAFSSFRRSLRAVG